MSHGTTHGRVGVSGPPSVQVGLALYLLIICTFTPSQTFSWTLEATCGVHSDEEASSKQVVTGETCHRTEACGTETQAGEGYV